MQVSKAIYLVLKYIKLGLWHLLAGFLCYKIHKISGVTYMNQYETIIGLEVHVELFTASKIFCACSTRFGDKPNTNCCPVCLGMPGSLPVLNKRVVEHGVLVGLALNCDISKQSGFDRKNYFYPDLPKAYQVSQFYSPIGRNGHLTIDTGDGDKIIDIQEFHIEEDAGKLIHDAENATSLIDYNRAGIPLIEIVSGPDLRSAKEVVAYLDKLRMILRYLGVSDCKMQEGSFRADINLSVRKLGETELGTRTEMKNMNSFKAIKRAIEEESKRQIGVLEAGGKIVQETRRWDDNGNKSIGMRSKAEVDDYRYYPDPDLPLLEISEDMIIKLQTSLPEFRDEKIVRYQKEYGISETDAEVITSSKEMADLFERTAKLCGRPREVSNWLMVEGMRILKEEDMDPWDIRLTPDRLWKIILMIDKGRLNRTKAKEVFEKVFVEGLDPEEYVVRHGLGMISDDKALRVVVVKVLDDNPQSVIDFKSGKTKAYGYLVGQAMKAMKGKADPGLINSILKELLQ